MSQSLTIRVGSKREAVYNCVSDTEFETIKDIEARVPPEILNHNNVVPSCLFQLASANLVERKAIGKRFLYKKNNNIKPNFVEPKSEKNNYSKKNGTSDMRNNSRGEEIEIFLQRNQGSTFSIKDFAEQFDYDSNSNAHYQKLSDLHKKGKITRLPGQYPVMYKINPVENHSKPVQQELQNIPSATVLKDLASIPALNISESINNIVKIDQQNQMYRQALHQIATILESIDFLESN